MNFPVFELCGNGSDMWTGLIELACDAEMCPDMIEEEVESRSSVLISCAEWLQSQEWEEWGLQAGRLLEYLEDTLEGCLCLLDDGDLDTACQIWRNVRRQVFNLEEDIVEGPRPLLEMLG